MDRLRFKKKDIASLLACEKNCYAMFSVESRRQDKARLSLHYNLIIVKSTVTVLIKIAANSARGDVSRRERLLTCKEKKKREGKERVKRGQIDLPRLINPLISRLWEAFSRLVGP